MDVVEPGGPFEELAGRWQVEQVGDTTVVAGTAPVLEVRPDGQVSGNGGVNRFTGRMDVIGDDVQFGPLATTRMAGPPDAMEQERALLAALTGRRTISMSADELVLGNPEGGAAVRLRRLPPEA